MKERLASRVRSGIATAAVVILLGAGRVLWEYRGPMPDTTEYQQAVGSAIQRKYGDSATFEIDDAHLSNASAWVRVPGDSSSPFRGKTVLCLMRRKWWGRWQVTIDGPSGAPPHRALVKPPQGR